MEYWKSLGVWAELASEAETRRPLWLQLSPAWRLRVLLALFSIMVLGLLLLLFTRSFGRLVRYYATALDRGGERHRSTTPLRADDWAEQPLRREKDDEDPFRTAR